MRHAEFHNILKQTVLDPGQARGVTMIKKHQATVCTKRTPPDSSLWDGLSPIIEKHSKDRVLCVFDPGHRVSDRDHMLLEVDKYRGTCLAWSSGT